MGRQGSEGVESLPAVSAPERALPLEYRYRTSFAGSLFAGVMILIGIVVLGGGRLNFFLLVLGLILCGYGLVVFSADPDGFWHSVGKRLIISDECLEEVDEEWRVRWVILPGEVKTVKKHLGRPVLPFGINQNWRVEVWEIFLKDGKRVKIPVWLLPEGGRNFKQRFETFLKFSTERLKKEGSVVG